MWKDGSYDAVELGRQRIHVSRLVRAVLASVCDQQVVKLTQGGIIVESRGVYLCPDPLIDVRFPSKILLPEELKDRLAGPPLRIPLRAKRLHPQSCVKMRLHSATAA